MQEYTINLEQIEAEEDKTIELPKNDKLISEFARQLVKKITPNIKLFYRVKADQIIKINSIKVMNDSEESYLGMVEVKPNALIGLIEQYVIPGHYVFNQSNKEWEFKKKSISMQLASTLLQTDELKQGLPQITRVLHVPIPMRVNGKITFPKRGYDERFGTYLPFDAPVIDKNMNINEAKQILEDIYSEFCFKTMPVDRDMAIAGLLTPFLRGLYPNYNDRTPAFIYMANTPGAGKDYCAGITSILYEGVDIQDPPLAGGEKNTNSTQELRKKILASFMEGRPRIHFSNNIGHLHNPVLDEILTSPTHSDRKLGHNTNIKLPNEMDYSLSANTGFTYNPDLTRRIRFIRLFFEGERVTDRKFKERELHKWVLENRGKILSALYSLVKDWEEKGSKEGSLSFSSFPSWDKLCGGIMENAGYMNPCEVDKDIDALAGDTETSDMKLLFELVNEVYPGKIATINDIMQIAVTNDLFTHLDIASDKPKDKAQFGKIITKYVGRVLSNIKLTITKPGIKPARQNYVFKKIEDWEIRDYLNEGVN